MAVSLKSIAQDAGVSVMTASKILNLNEAHRFRAETVKKVESAALRLGYTPNRSAQVMRSQRSGIIGLVSCNYNARIGMPEGYPMHFFQAGLIHELGLTNQHVATVEWTEFEPKSVGDIPLPLRQRFFDGLVVHFDLSKQAHHLLQEFDIPLVYIDCGISEPYNCLVRNEYRATHELLEEMYSYGYQKIAFYLPKGVSTTISDKKIEHFSLSARYSAYKEFMQKRGSKPVLVEGLNPDHIVAMLQESNADAVMLEGFGSAAFHIAIARLAAKGKLLGYASTDVEARGRHTRELAGMQYDRFEVGRIAARMIQSAINNNQRDIPSQEISSFFVTGSSLPSAIIPA